ncbi:MAG: C40 family peptidase [Marinirhabdus sp.]
MPQRILNIHPFKNLLPLLFGTMLTSCASSLIAPNTAVVAKPAKTTANHIIANIVTTAKAYTGTHYKFGGTDRRGMDCSGLVYVAFKEENIALPRASRDMAKKGTPVNLNEVSVGDLLFFRTSKARKNINHVGLVVEASPGQIKFIHSTNSRGVIISSLGEKYWNDAFAESRRIL